MIVNPAVQARRQCCDALHTRVCSSDTRGRSRKYRGSWNPRGNRSQSQICGTGTASAPWRPLSTAARYRHHPGPAARHGPPRGPQPPAAAGPPGATAKAPVLPQVRPAGTTRPSMLRIRLPTAPRRGEGARRAG